MRFFAMVCLPALLLLGTTSFMPGPLPAFKTGHLKLTFINTANGKAVTLRDSMYVNPSGEQYSISKLKYYISNINLSGSSRWRDEDGYYLINEATGEKEIDLSLPAGKYNNLEFLLGVDSLRNCSGAQTGALDPLNDMFWTWNSGYVMFKLEGNSPASTADLQRIEHHVGGYKGADNVATKINFNFTGQQLEIRETGTTAVVIEMNLDHYWQSNSVIRIAEAPVCMTTGPLAKKIASNFTSLFSLKNISSNP